MGSVAYETEEQWHSLRAKNVGGSEVAALFNISPWMTRWQLYMVKSGKLPAVDLSDNAAVTAGKHMEHGIRGWAEEKFGITLQKTRRYLLDDMVPGMGASLDFEQVGTGSRIPVEVKFSQFGKDGWAWDGDTLTEVPDHYLMQTQHQMACANAAESKLIAFVGGDLRSMSIPRNDRLIIAIRAAVASFWDDVKNDREPPVDFSADSDAINRLAYLRKLRSLVMTPDRAPLFEALAKAKADAKDAETREDAARAEILKAVVDAGEGPDTALVVTCGDWRAALSKIPDNPGKEVTPDMVGTRIGAKRGHLRVGLKNTTDKKKD